MEVGKAEVCLVNQAPPGLWKYRAGGKLGRGGERTTHKTVSLSGSGSASQLNHFLSLFWISGCGLHAGLDI